MRRRLLILVLLAVIPLTAVIAYNVFHLYSHLQSDALRTTERDAARLASNVDRFDQQLLQQTTAVGLAVTENHLSTKQANEYLSSLASQVPVNDYSVLDPSGRVVASAIPGLRGADLSQDPAVREVQAGAPASVSGLRRNPSGRPGFALFTRLERDNVLVGIAGLYVDAGDLAIAVPDRPPEATIVVTDQHGRLLYSDEPSVTAEVAGGFGLRGLWTVRDALAGREAIARDVTLPGLPGSQVGAQVPVGGIGWTAGYYLPRATAFADVRRELLLTGLIVAIVVALVLFFARSYALAITVPLAKLTDAADQVSKGRFDTPLELRAPDEVGTLAEDFHRMQISLAHTFDDVATLTEAAGRINSSLEVSAILGIGFGYLRDVLDASVVVATLSRESGRGVDIHASGVDQPFAEELSAAVTQEFPPRELYRVDQLLVDLAKDRPAGLPLPPGEPRFLLVIPLTVRTRNVGRIDAYCSPTVSDAEFVRSAVPLAMSLTRQLAIALANARLFERQQLIADTLQDSLLSEPYRISGLDVEVLYRPATVGARIGGDFFDFMPVGEHDMAIVVGDISGKGIDAARYTAIAKGAIRTLAYEDPWPGSVLQRASHVIAEQTQPDTFVTAVYVLIDATTGHVHYSNAGHPPPLLVPRTGQVQTLLGHGPPLGVIGDWIMEEGEARLEEGDRLLLFTDGLTEARVGSDLFGSEGVARAAVELREVSLADLPGQLVLRAARHANGRLADDLAVVAVEKTARED